MPNTSRLSLIYTRPVAPEWEVVAEMLCALNNSILVPFYIGPCQPQNKRDYSVATSVYGLDLGSISSITANCAAVKTARASATRFLSESVRTPRVGLKLQGFTVLTSSLESWTICTANPHLSFWNLLVMRTSQATDGCAYPRHKSDPHDDPSL
ncbi:hypothetical protein BJY04DRAFT_148083 [Aspergillus karnatakaensis]|uniref:uncharacterized protein n=1 Tax=Aspergillus karnatakaensis TaxID=1810916 RepID=UPI003CCDF942